METIIFQRINSYSIPSVQYIQGKMNYKNATLPKTQLYAYTANAHT